MSRLKTSIPKWGPRKGGWPLWGRGDAKPLAEFPDKQEMEKCGLRIDENKVVPRNFYALEETQGRFLF